MIVCLLGVRSGGGGELAIAQRARHMAAYENHLPRRRCLCLRSHPGRVSIQPRSPLRHHARISIKFSLVVPALAESVVNAVLRDSRPWNSCGPSDAMSKVPFGRASHAGLSPAADPRHALTERRSEPRRRTHDAGKLAFGYGTAGLDCTILDLSHAGAHVQTTLDTASLPKTLFLVHLQNRIAWEAKVVWCDDDRLGLQFILMHDLSRPATAELKAMSQMCDAVDERRH